MNDLLDRWLEERGISVNSEEDRRKVSADFARGAMLVVWKHSDGSADFGVKYKKP